MKVSKKQIIELQNSIALAENAVRFARKKMQDLQESYEFNDELDEKWGTATKVSPAEKGKYSGKNVDELLKSYRALKKSGPHKRGSPEYGRMRELAFAIRAKTGWGGVGD